MTALSLTKNYGDLTLLFADDLHNMWVELEAKVNGNIDSSVVASGWASWGQVALASDTDYSWGATSSAATRFYSSTNEFVIMHITTARTVYFKVNGTAVGTLDTSGNLSVTNDVYFFNRSTTYPLSYLIGYQKPVLVYTDATTITLEQNTATSNTSLIVFPSGPIAISSSFRTLSLSVYANGYSSSHVGAAQSGFKAGIVTSANTWYFVYAVIVQGGSDAGNNFILVAHDTTPSPTNWSSIDSTFGSGKWVYIGMFRIGHGEASTTTLVPFVQDHQGWHTFIGRGASDNFLGIKVATTSVTSSSAYTTLATIGQGSSGNSVPDNCSMCKVMIRPTQEGTSMNGMLCVSDSGDTVMTNLPSFGVQNDADTPHGFEVKIPVGYGIKIRGKKAVSA